MELKGFEIVDQMQKKCKKHLLTKTYIERVLEEYKDMLGISHKALKGIVIIVDVCGRQTYSKWAEKSSYCVVEHKGSHWQITEADRGWLRESPRVLARTIPDEAKKAIIEKAVQRSMRMP